MGWSAQYFTTIIISGNTPQTGIFIYNGPPSLGNLIGSWADQAGSDAFGNTWPAGINVTQGQLSGVTITNAQIINAILTSPVINNPTISQGNAQGMTIAESKITFDSVGGLLLVYTSTTTTVTFSTAGANNWSVPANVLVGKIETWGADAGAGGGSSSVGGEGGGAGEYACEPNYSFVGKTTIPYNVGAKGLGGQTGSPGTGGGQTSFDSQGVVAGGGNAGSNFTGGLGANISTNTIHFPGGNGGNGNLGTASAGGGGRAGSTGAGGNGGNGGSSPGAAGAAGTGTGGLAGGAGVAASNNGNAGGGGSGAGQGGSGTTYINKFYDPTSTDSYYGSGVGGGLHDHNGNMYQGCPNTGTGNFPGDELSYANYNHSQIASDFSGATIDSVSLTINNLHSWYNTGNYLILSYSDGGGDHYTGDYYWTNEGQTATIDVSSPLNGQIKTLTAIKLGPSALTGNATSLYNYGYYQGGAGAGGPRLTVKGHIGSAGNFTAGNGSDGVIKITYTSATTLLAAIAPVAGTDVNGNGYGAGYTGPVQAFTPGTNPTTAEVWHAIPLTNSWTIRTGGYTAQYRMTADNVIEITGEVSHASTSGTSQLATALPTAYFPAQNQDGVAYATATTSGICTVFLNTSGVLTFFALPAGTTTVAFSVRFAKNGIGGS